MLCSSLQENFPRARRCLDVYCAALPQVEPGDEQLIHIFNELYYGHQAARILQTLQKTLASLDRFQNVLMCLKSITVSLCQKKSRDFSMLLQCFYHLPGCWHRGSKSLKCSDVEILHCCFAMFDFAWFAVHDINIHIEHEMWWIEVVTTCNMHIGLN